MSVNITSSGLDPVSFFLFPFSNFQFPLHRASPAINNLRNPSKHRFLPFVDIVYAKGLLGVRRPGVSITKPLCLGQCQAGRTPRAAGKERRRNMISVAD